VLSFEHGPDTLWSKVCLERLGDLGGQTLLDLKAAGEELNHPGELRQADDAAPGHVPNVGDADEG
jgi:hypothetical protein